MMKKHEKPARRSGGSPCCGDYTVRFGGRRRQCVQCKHTWSVWKKKRGRKRKRGTIALATRFVLNHTLPLVVPRSGHYQSPQQRQYALSLSRRLMHEKLSWPKLPENTEFVAVADGMVKYLGKQWHTWYFILLRPIEGDRAIILPPYHRIGTETYRGWFESFKQIPDIEKGRIKALVCDGHVGLVGYAKTHDWLVQRCHFHLIARLQSQRSRWRKGRHQTEARAIYEAVNVVLTDRDEQRVLKALERIRALKETTVSNEVRKVLRGFLATYIDYRTYLTFPNLRLPTTNNTAETLVHLVERLSSRARGFGTADMFSMWVANLIKVRKTVRCAPKNQQN